MKCSKCGKEATLKNGLCKDCHKIYKDITNFKLKKLYHSKFIMTQLGQDEKIISKVQNSNLLFYFIAIIFAISIILFPRTIIEVFFIKNHTFFIVLFANIALLFLGIFLSFYFLSREIYLTNKRIFGKSGIFKVKKINIPLNQIQNIDIALRALEISTPTRNFTFDYISNADSFRISTINQVHQIINETNDENIIMSFSNSMNEKLEEYKLNEKYPNMICCKCCKQMISKDSLYCVHCGQPITENEKEADFLLKLICFLIPPFGILIFLIHIGEHPRLSKQCLFSSILSLFIILSIYLSVKNII